MRNKQFFKDEQGGAMVELAVIASLLLIASLPLFQRILPKLNEFDQESNVALAQQGALNTTQSFVSLDITGDLRPLDNMSSALGGASEQLKVQTQNTQDFCVMSAEMIADYQECGPDSFVMQMDSDGSVGIEPPTVAGSEIVYPCGNDQINIGDIKQAMAATGCTSRFMTSAVPSNKPENFIVYPATVSMQ